MALVTCPHCGQTISSVAKICVHCGRSVECETACEEKKEIKKTNYDDLSVPEKSNLRKEFNTRFREYAKYVDRTSFYKKLKIMSWVFIGLAAVAAFIAYKLMNIPLLVIAIVVFFTSEIYDVIYPWLIYADKKKQLRILKRYVKWLNDEKGIIYNVTFSKENARFKKYYDSVNVDYEKI